MEYRGNVFGCPNKDRPVYVSGNSVIVNASSLDEALKLIEQGARLQFPETSFPMVHIDAVFKGQEQVYKTAWDEIGPLAAFRLDAA